VFGRKGGSGDDLVKIGIQRRGHELYVPPRFFVENLLKLEMLCAVLSGTLEKIKIYGED